VCTSPNIAPIFDIPAVPADTIRLWPTRAAACYAPKGRISLAFCDDCGHLFNCCYDDDLVNYGADYENSQMLSPKFRRYAEQLSDRLITTYHLYRKNIVEIGGGRGEFLRIMCDRGSNNGVCFDPSYRPSGAEDDIRANVRFVADYYTAKYEAEPADLIVCRHVLEHFGEPRELIATVRRAVAARKDVIVYFEVPNGEFILREQMFWELIYQHCSYFTRSSLCTLFTMCGFRVRSIQEPLAGQVLAIEASAPPNGVVSNARLSHGSELGIPALGRRLGAAFDARVVGWRDRLAQLKDNRQRIVAWGAGAKATTFLNIIDPIGSVISYVVDINPRKWGRFVPGAGQQKIDPNSLMEIRPDVIIVINQM
jgi:hypothetical protein